MIQFSKDILVVFASNGTECTGATGALLAPVKRSSWALNFFWRGALSFRVRAKVDGSLVQQLVAKVLQFKYLKNNIKKLVKRQQGKKNKNHKSSENLNFVLDQSRYKKWHLFFLFALHLKFLSVSGEKSGEKDRNRKKIVHVKFVSEQHN